MQSSAESGLLTPGLFQNLLRGGTIHFPNLYESSVSYLEDSMKPLLIGALRPRICAGNSETLAVQVTTRPRCNRKLRLMWPEYILQIPLHRVVSLDCPGCANSFSLIAADLVPVLDGAERYTPAVVNHLS
jgi:hypothetical protein